MEDLDLRELKTIWNKEHKTKMDRLKVSQERLNTVILTMNNELQKNQEKNRN